jgi:MFS superfamily sulfate permease-like transporter
VMVPVQLVVVIVGSIVATVLEMFGKWDLDAEPRVALPDWHALSSSSWVLPSVDALSDANVWRMALTLAVIASIDALLSVDAADRLDPHHRTSPPNRELLAQGVGNVVAGLCGGLPVTSVVVRSSVGVMAGARSKWSTIVHGVLLGIAVFAAALLNHIPLAALAVILIVVGYRLTSLSIWRSAWQRGPAQFAPFAITVIAVVFTDMLTGTLMGAFAGVAFAIAGQVRHSFVMTESGNDHLLRTTKDLAFFGRMAMKSALASVPPGASLRIDLSRSDYIDSDVIELLRHYIKTAAQRRIDVSIQDRSGRNLLEDGP